jgi:hypothetical protein
MTQLMYFARQPPGQLFGIVVEFCDLPEKRGALDKKG